MSGSRDAMLIGAALLVVGAVYVALRGNHATANVHDTDDAPDDADQADEATSHLRSTRHRAGTFVMTAGHDRALARAERAAAAGAPALGAHASTIATHRVGEATRRSTRRRSCRSPSMALSVTCAAWRWSDGRDDRLVLSGSLRRRQRVRRAPRPRTGGHYRIAPSSRGARRSSCTSRYERAHYRSCRPRGW